MGYPGWSLGTTLGFRAKSRWDFKAGGGKGQGSDLSGPDEDENRSKDETAVLVGGLMEI